MSDVLAGALSLLLATNKTALLNTALVERAGITVPMNATMIRWKPSSRRSFDSTIG